MSACDQVSVTAQPDLRVRDAHRLHVHVRLHVNVHQWTRTRSCWRSPATSPRPPSASAPPHPPSSAGLPTSSGCSRSSPRPPAHSSPSPSPESQLPSSPTSSCAPSEFATVATPDVSVMRSASLLSPIFASVMRTDSTSTYDPAMDTYPFVLEIASDVPEAAECVSTAASSVISRSPDVVRLLTVVAPAPSAFVTVAESSVAAPRRRQRPVCRHRPTVAARQRDQVRITTHPDLRVRDAHRLHVHVRSTNGHVPVRAGDRQRRPRGRRVRQHRRILRHQQVSRRRQAAHGRRPGPQRIRHRRRVQSCSPHPSSTSCCHRPTTTTTSPLVSVIRSGHHSPRSSRP